MTTWAEKWNVTYPCEYCTENGTFHAWDKQGDLRRACRRHRERLEGECQTISFPKTRIWRVTDG